MVQPSAWVIGAQQKHQTPTSNKIDFTALNVCFLSLLAFCPKGGAPTQASLYTGNVGL